MPGIYFVGAHSTGKTTLAKWLCKTQSLSLVHEVARTLSAEMEMSIVDLRKDINVFGEFQRSVLEKQFKLECKYDGRFYVSDRAFDNLIYTAEHTLITNEVFHSKVFKDYVKHTKKGLVFFLRPHVDLLINDGTREPVAWDDIVRLDGMVKILLEITGVPYVTINTPILQERIKTVITHVSLYKQTTEKR